MAEQKALNKHVKGHDEHSFIKVRSERDRTLPMPKLILSALQVNFAGGCLPQPDDDGRRFLKIRLDAFDRSVPWA